MPKAFRYVVRLISGYQFTDRFPNIRVVSIRRIRKAFHSLKERVRIEGDRVADMDELVVSPAKPLFGHELFLVELLPRPQTGVFDLDIYILRRRGHKFRQEAQG